MSDKSKSLNWNLFIDDQIDEINEDTGIAIRDPKIIDPSREYIGAKSVEEAISLILEKGCPQFISFDHDLGIDQNGSVRDTTELVKWLIDEDQKNGIIPKDFNYQVHSKNVYAKQRLSLLRDWLDFKNRSSF